MENKTCCFTGHRDIPTHQYDSICKVLKTKIINLIDIGYCYFGVGGALGFDTIAAQVILELRRSYTHIKLILVLPCMEQTKGWSDNDIATYEDKKTGATSTPTHQNIIIRAVCTNATSTL